MGSDRNVDLSGRGRRSPHPYSVVASAAGVRGIQKTSGLPVVSRDAITDGHCADWFTSVRAWTTRTSFS